MLYGRCDASFVEILRKKGQKNNAGEGVVRRGKFQANEELQISNHNNLDLAFNGLLHMCLE